jgi:hypothetical protein
MVALPCDNEVPVHLLASVFNRTTATYKFYWFLSILESLLDEPEIKVIPIRWLLSRMISNAWYPVHYFRISFGLSDRLRQHTVQIRDYTGIPIDAGKTEIFQRLRDSKNKRIEHLIMHFNKCVPYRFLSPWFPGANDKEVIQYSASFQNCCLYRINAQTSTIEIHPDWRNYLLRNHRILNDFCYWNLVLFLQVRNPNVPDIANKIIKPVFRESMVRQRNFWNTVFQAGEPIKCIYTGELLEMSNYTLEHFIPWSFVSHNQIWNLVPVVHTVNSSKGNRLPDINRYLDPFVIVQKHAVQTVYQLRPRDSILEDYLVLGETISEVANMPILYFQEKYRKLMCPLIQIAENMGYEYWQF